MITRSKPANLPYWRAATLLCTAEPVGPAIDGPPSTAAQVKAPVATGPSRGRWISAAAARGRPTSTPPARMPVQAAMIRHPRTTALSRILPGATVRGHMRARPRWVPWAGSAPCPRTLRTQRLGEPRAAARLRRPGPLGAGARVPGHVRSGCADALPHLPRRAALPRTPDGRGAERVDPPGPPDGPGPAGRAGRREQPAPAGGPGRRARPGPGGL